MYTLSELESKTFGELKKIGYELNVHPEGDRRCRQSWIDALVNVNPPLLQLLEASPAVSVEQVSEAIAQAAENSPGVESVEPTQKAQEHKFLLCLKDGDNTLWYDGKDFVFEMWSAKTYCKRGVGAAKHTLRFHPEVKRVGNVLQVVENFPRVEQIDIQCQEPIAQAAQTSPGVEVEPVQEAPLESKFGRIVYPKQAAKPSAQNEEARPQLDRTESADVHNLGSHPTKSDRDSSGAKTEALGSQVGDRVLAVARDCQTGQGRVLPDRSIKLVNQAQEPIEDYLDNTEFLDITELWELDQPDCPACGGIYSLQARWSKEYAWGYWVIYCQECDRKCSCSVEQLPRCLREDEDDDEDSEKSLDVDWVQEPIAQEAKTPPGVEEVDRRQEPLELALDEELPSEEEARSIVSQYFISTSLRKIRSAGPPARIFCPGERVRIIEVAAGSCNSQFCGSIGIVAQHNSYVSVWVELNGGGRKIVFCSPEELELIELVARESAAKQEPIEIQRQEPIENSPGVEVDPVQELIDIQRQEPIARAAKNPGAKVAAQYQKAIDLLEQKNLAELEEIAWCVSNTGVQLLPEGDPQCRQSLIDALVANLLAKNIHPFALQYLCRRYVIAQEASSAELQRQDPIAQEAKTPPGVEEVDRRQEPIEQAAKISLNPKFDQNPILTNADAWDPAEFGEVLHAAEPSGQLNLLEWDVSEPPEPDDYEGDIFAFQAAYDRWLLTDQLHETIHTKTSPSITQAPEPIAQNATTRLEFPRNESADLRFVGFHPAQPDGNYSSTETAGLGNQEGDRVLEVAGNPQAHQGRVIPHQPTQLSQSHDSHVGYLELEIGMLVGRRRDRQHLGKILAIYKSRRGIWRAKIKPLNKSNFVYFDCAALIEQRLLYDYEMKPGGFLPCGSTFDKTRGEKFEVYSRKVRSPKPTNWTAGELRSLSTFKLKQIARDMEIPSIPGTAGKRSLIRAILAEQAILQEKAAAQRERETGRAIFQKQKSAPTTGNKKRAGASPQGFQLSLFVAV